MKRQITSKSVVLIIILSLFVAFFLSAQTALAKEGRKVIKLRCIAGHPAQAAPWVRVMKSYFVPELKKRVLSETKNYELKIQENYGGSVAALGEVLEAVETGIGDMGMVVWCFDTAKLHPHNATGWFPFTSPDMTMVLKAWRKTWEKFPFLEETLAKYNQKSLAFPSCGTYQIISTFPIKKLEDMKGHKLANGGPMLPWINAVGSVGVQSRLNEAYNSMQTGVYDGWFSPTSAVVGFKMYEPAPFFTMVDLGSMITQTVTINLDTWKRLPKEVQEIMIQVGRDFEEAEAKELTNDYYKKIVYMATQGTTIRKLSDIERKRFAAAMDKALVADAMAKESEGMGYKQASEMARFYVKALNDLGYNWPVVPTIK